MGPPRACGCAHAPDDRYTPCEMFAGSLAGVQWNVAGRTNGALVRTGGLAGAVAACAPTGESAVIAPASAKTVDRRAISDPSAVARTSGIRTWRRAGSGRLAEGRSHTSAGAAQRVGPCKRLAGREASRTPRHVEAEPRRGPSLAIVRPC